MIISAVYQTIYRYLLRGFSLDEAIQAPRVHHQYLPHQIRVRPHRMSPEVITALKRKGHKVEVSKYSARVYAVSRTEEGLLEGAFDNRGEGAAGGL